MLNETNCDWLFDMSVKRPHGPWPMKAAIYSRPSAVSLKVWLREDYMRPYNEYRQFTPIQKGAPAAMQCCLITASRRTANAVRCALENKAPRQWPHAVSERVAHMDWQRSIFYRLAHSTICERELCAHVSYLSHSAQIQICVFVCVRAPARSLQRFPYTSRINFRHYLSN